MTRPIALYDLGLVPYGPTHRLQQTLVEQRRGDEVSDLVLLLEHTPVITLGRRADPAHLLAGPAELAEQGIEVHQTERGGDVTYHGPGQLVVYPILRLRDHGLGPSDYMHLLEDVVTGVLAGYGIAAGRREQLIGVWVDADKICALGVRVMRGITMHGLALNVAPEMAHWQLIVPCGIRDGGVTSMARELGNAPPLQVVGQRVGAGLAAALGLEAVWQESATLPWPKPTPGIDPAQP
jgi:lipoyl(octanoyl) transferase